MQAYLQSPLQTYSQYQAPSRSEHPDSTERTISVINLRDALVRPHREPHVASDPLERREVEGFALPATLYFLSLQHAPLSRQTPQIQQAHTAPQPETRPRRPITCRAATRRISPGTRQALGVCPAAWRKLGAAVDI